MPFYRFLIHGRFVESRSEYRGFYTHRWAWSQTQDKAAGKALDSVARDWRSGRSSALHAGLPPVLEIEEGYEIAFWQIWDAPNRGYTLYDDD